MKRFKQILCIVDSRDGAKTALERAVSLAENNQARLKVFVVVENISVAPEMLSGGPSADELMLAAVEMWTRDLETLVKPYRSRIAIEIEISVGVVFLETIRDVLRHAHDLVIKTAEPQDWLDRLLGSSDMHLLRKCPCPVWIIKPNAPNSHRRILVAVDVDDACPPRELAARRALNQEALELAGSLAISEFAELHVVNVWLAPGEGMLRRSFLNAPEDEVDSYVNDVRCRHELILDTIIAELTSKLGAAAEEYLIPRLHLVKGTARREIPALAKRIDADLIVMGTVARTGVPGFIMGNTAETILGQIDCSVLAIKPPGFVTPVTLRS